MELYNADKQDFSITHIYDVFLCNTIINEMVQEAY